MGTGTPPPLRIGTPTLPLVRYYIHQWLPLSGPSIPSHPVESSPVAFRSLPSLPSSNLQPLPSIALLSLLLKVSSLLCLSSRSPAVEDYWSLSSLLPSRHCPGEESQSFILFSNFLVSSPLLSSPSPFIIGRPFWLLSLNISVFDKLSLVQARPVNVEVSPFLLCASGYP